MKLRTRTRTGSRVRRMYDRAQTPFQRVLASGVLDRASERRCRGEGGAEGWIRSHRIATQGMVTGLTTSGECGSDALSRPKDALEAEAAANSAPPIDPPLR